MAATEKGVWNLQDVRDKELLDQWSYEGAQPLFMTGVSQGGSMGINLGDGTYRSSPTQVPGNWNSFSASYYQSTATKSDGTLWAWGTNQNGALGQNNLIKRSSPTQIGTGTDWDKVAMAADAAIATKTDGTLWAWGSNQYFCLGLNSSNPALKRSSPVQVGTDSDWPTTAGGGVLDGGQMTFAAIKTDGSLWRWGQNEKGQLGQNNKTTYSSPKQVPGTWTDVSLGWYGAMQIKSGGLYFTGWGSRYQNGLGDQTDYSSPKLVPGSPGAGPFGTVVKTNLMERGGGFCINDSGELFSWGYNSDGQLGKNTTTVQYYSPQQIPGTTWRTISGARTASFADKTDGTLWSWGQNFQGYLGIATRTSRSSPTQVGAATNWDLSRSTSTYYAGAMGFIQTEG